MNQALQNHVVDGMAEYELASRIRVLEVQRSFLTWKCNKVPCSFSSSKRPIFRHVEVKNSREWHNIPQWSLYRVSKVLRQGPSWYLFGFTRSWTSVCVHCGCGRPPFGIAKDHTWPQGAWCSDCCRFSSPSILLCRNTPSESQRENRNYRKKLN